VKKLFLIFLLMVLPLQYSWAAAAAYCQHEKEPVTHFGHHSHQHEAEAPSEAPENGSELAQVHNDCGVCQFAGQASFLTAPLNVLAPPTAFALPPLFVSFTSYIAEGPQRPDRHFVA
jgi:hypothetical protein